MQSDSELRATLAVLVECPTCYKPFTRTVRKPKLVSQCRHTMCLQCGLALCAWHPVEWITCPVCLREAPLAVGGFAVLPDFPTTLELLDINAFVSRDCKRRSTIDQLLADYAIKIKSLGEIESISSYVRSVRSKLELSSGTSSKPLVLTLFSSEAASTSLPPRRLGSAGDAKSEKSSFKSSGMTPAFEKRCFSTSERVNLVVGALKEDIIGLGGRVVRASKTCVGVAHTAVNIIAHDVRDGLVSVIRLLLKVDDYLRTISPIGNMGYFFVGIVVGLWYS